MRQTFCTLRHLLPWFWEDRGRWHSIDSSSGLKQGSDVKPHKGRYGKLPRASVPPANIRQNVSKCRELWLRAWTGRGCQSGWQDLCNGVDEVLRCCKRSGRFGKGNRRGSGTNTIIGA